jgi:hypothetical protein
MLVTIELANDPLFKASNCNESVLYLNRRQYWMIAELDGLQIQICIFVDDRFVDDRFKLDDMFLWWGFCGAKLRGIRLVDRQGMFSSMRA